MAVYDKLLYSSKELFDSYLQGKTYSIPPYQRGYKWDTKDIERLLKDINEFSPNEDLNLFYCLQNITLVESQDSKTFNVVDGQQRLTTLTVILSYLNEYELINEKLQYNVRKETEEFLKEYIFKPNELKNIQNWEQFLENTSIKGKDYDYQDVFYLFNAYKAIQTWFETYPNSVTAMKDKILNHVKLIVNLPKNIEEQELFENLNGKRVPLDGADLIRALIITRVAKKEIGDIDDSIKQNVLINERRVKIGLMLDRINHWWADENKKNYFHQFTKESKVPDEESISFNDVTYPINHLYKLYVLAYGEGVLDMEFFEKKVIEDGFLDELQLLQRTMENWCNDKELYHLILFTSIYAREKIKEEPVLSFKELLHQWKKLYRKDFIRFLKKRIASTEVFNDLINQTERCKEENEKTAFLENWYDNKLITVSVLLDIISILSSNSTCLPARHFKAYKEDLEHIFPQTPVGDRIKDKIKQTQILKEYIDIINQSLSEEEKININDCDIDWENQSWKDDIKFRINNRIEKVIPVNSLGNMCVLHESVNRGYGNDFFLEKRIDIMRKSQEGFFIRPHVYDAFNKIFLERHDESIDMKMMNRWDRSDILARREYIIKRISNFLNTSNEQA
uniref:DUF262 domain-containing protein n=1 Tax=Prevotella sp. TaxID=59823 RepID=UPI004024F1E7